MSNVTNQQALAANAALPRPRRGSFVVRMALARVANVQDPRALHAAGRIVLAMPVIQIVLLVGVLDAQWWQALLGLEGLVIAALAHAQLRRGSIETKLVGYGIALLNAGALGAIGLALGGHLFWVTGAICMVPVTMLVFGRTGTSTVRNALAAVALPMLLLAAGCGYARFALVHSQSQQDPAAQSFELRACWYAYLLRGGNGTERALLRLRQAQAAFAAKDFVRAYELAHDGAYNDRGDSRVPATAIGAGLLDSLLRLKAQAFYNQAWKKDEKLWTPIAPDPMPQDMLSEESVSVRWGW